VRRTTEVNVLDVSALRMREATIAAGIWLSYGVAALGGLYVLLTWDRPNRFELTWLFVAAMAAALAVSLLPREQIVRGRLREPFFLAWSMIDAAMLFVGTLADGGTSSPLTIVFFLPIVFASMSYPLRSVLVVGVMCVLSYTILAVAAGGAGAAFEVGFATVLAATAAVSAWQAQNHERQHAALADASRTDPLTGALNRRGFEERVENELSAVERRTTQGGALVMIDLDHFKPVNDTYGHVAGDELLCWVAGTLKDIVRPTDAVGRLGGDEFAVLLSALEGQRARALADRLGRALAERNPVSTGLAILPEDGTTIDELTRIADARLYAARAERRKGKAAPSRHERGPLESTRADGSAGGGEPLRAALESLPSRVAIVDGRDMQSMLLEHIDAAVIVTDMSGRVLSWNSGAEELYGWTQSEAVARRLRELIVPGDGEPVEEVLAGLRRESRWDGEFLARRKDSSTLTVYVRNRLIFDEAGQPSAIVGVSVDISGRDAAEREAA
jgi:diguanylate cyclase (GGDEF)-like protein/PAS domain S-box-containing protein